MFAYEIFNILSIEFSTTIDAAAAVVLLCVRHAIFEVDYILTHKQCECSNNLMQNVLKNRRVDLLENVGWFELSHFHSNSSIYNMLLLQYEIHTQS